MYNTLLSFIRKNRIAIFSGVVIGITTGILPREIISPILIVFVGLLTGIFLIQLFPKEDQKFLITIFISAFILRILVSLFIYVFVFVFRGGELIGDGQFHAEVARLITGFYHKGIMDLQLIKSYMPSLVIEGYHLWSAFIYFFFGQNPLSLIFINCLFGSLTIIFVYQIAKQLGNKKAAEFASFFTAFWPSTFLWSIQNLKEPITIFITCILAWGFVRIIKKFNFYLLLLIIASSIALKEFRIVLFGVFYLLVLPLSFLIMIWKKNKTLVISLITLLILCIYFLQGHQVILSHTINFPVNPGKFLEWAYQARAYRVVAANTAFLVNFDFSNVFGFIIFTPAALLFSWFAPFPWQLGSMLQAMAIPEMLIYYLLIPFMLSGMKYVIKNKINESVIIVVYILVMYFILAFLEGNIGTLFRHRSFILPFIFILAGIGIADSFGYNLKGNKNFTNLSSAVEK